MTRSEYLDCTVDDGIALVTMRRPPVNAVHQQMYVDIQRLFGDFSAAAPGARVAILTGEGRHFCGGNDLHEFATLMPENAPARMRAVRKAFFAIQDCPVPVIAAVRGTAAGTGLAIAASCDFVIAARGAKLSLPEVSVGVMGGARHLARLAPEPIVRWMFLSADPMPAEALAGYGCVLEVVAEDELLPTARLRAARIARHSPVALRLAKESLNRIETMDLKAGYEFEQSLTTEMCGHPDAKEAVQAFFERREPQYADPSATP
jgi:enoyl-CoA hydratase